MGGSREGNLRQRCVWMLGWSPGRDDDYPYHKMSSIYGDKYFVILLIQTVGLLNEKRLDRHLFVILFYCIVEKMKVSFAICVEITAKLASDLIKVTCNTWSYISSLSCCVQTTTFDYLISVLLNKDWFRK